MVVLPTPGGPHKIMLGTLPFSIAVRKMLPLPVRCCYPANSFKEDGRKRSANGADVFTVQISGINSSLIALFRNIY